MTNEANNISKSDDDATKGDHKSETTSTEPDMNKIKQDKNENAATADPHAKFAETVVGGAANASKAGTGSGQVSDDPIAGHPQNPIEHGSSATSSGPKPNDPFADLSKLRLSQDFGASLGVKKALLTVPVRKPAKEWFIQVHPDPSYSIETAVLELKEDRETYLVTPDLWAALIGESTFSPRLLTTAVNTLGVVFIWPIRLPGPDGKLDEWNRSALEAAAAARSGRWTRVQANMSLGAYEIWAGESTKLPAFPKVSFQELLRVAFKGRFIDSLEHPVLKRLRGEI